MIAELRTSLLTPKIYYELYMDVFNQLGSLEMYIAHLQRSGTSRKETYELVHPPGNVLVRLYVFACEGGGGHYAYESG